MEALVDAALTRRLQVLRLCDCTFAPALALPQLARLLKDGRSEHLWNLCIEDSPTLFANAQKAAIAALCEALEKCTRLTKLTLTNVGLHEEAHVYVELLLSQALASRRRRARSPAATATVTVA